MSDRYNSLVVVFEAPLKSEQAQAYIDAIKLFHGVVEVKGNVADISDFVNQSIVRNKLIEKLVDVIQNG